MLFVHFGMDLNSQPTQTPPQTATPPNPPKIPTPPVPPSPASIPAPIASSVTLPNQPQTPPANILTPLPPKPPVTPPTPPPTTKSPTLVPEKPISTTVDFSEKETAAEVIKYSIRTMAQDLERAQKEGVSAGVKLPSAPPPPPTPKISPLKAIPVMPSAPVAVTPTPLPPKPIAPVIGAIPTPTPIKPIPPIPETPRPIPTPLPMIKPLPPIEPSITPPTLKPSRLSFPHLNLVVGIIAAVVLLSGSIGFSYWWFFVREIAPIPPVVEEPIPEEKIPEIAEPELPKKIISTDRDIVVDVDTQVPSQLMTSKITAQLSSKTFDLNTKELGRILIKYSTDKEKTYLSFNQSLLMLGLTMPQNVSREISDGEILVYSQNGKMRYGFAAKISGGLQTLDAMNTWETTMVNDIQPLLIDVSPTKPQDGMFRDNFYESFIKSYFNFVELDMSIDWGVSDDKKLLVIATSKDMIYEIIDSIPVIGQ